MSGDCMQILFDGRSSDSSLFRVISVQGIEDVHPALTNADINCEMWLTDILTVIKEHLSAYQDPDFSVAMV